MKEIYTEMTQLKYDSLRKLYIIIYILSSTGSSFGRPLKNMSPGPGVLSHREPTELGCWVMFLFRGRRGSKDKS